MQNTPKSPLANCQPLAQHIQRLFDDKVLDLFLFECQRLIESSINLKEFGLYYKLDFDLDIQYRSMKRVMVESDRLIKMAYQPDEGWKTIQVDEQCVISVRSNGTIMELKSRGALELDIKHALIMAYLIKLYTQCFPFCKEAYDVKQPTKLQKIGFLRLSLPIPLVKDRSTLLRGIGFQYRGRPHKVCIFAEGINDNGEYLQQNKVDPAQFMKGQELLDFKHFAVEMTYLAQKKIEYVGYAIVDHHIPILPDRLVLFVAKEMGKHIFNKLMKKLQKFDETVWAKEIKENYAQNAHFYDWINNFVNVWASEVANNK